MSKRCLGCMELFGDEFEICPHCGYILGTPAEEAVHIEPGTLLYDRYIVGRVLGYGGFGVTYLGWDGKLEQKVAIKEYLPSEFSTRMPGQSQITVFNGEKNEQFYDGLTKFVEEAKHLAKFQNEEGIVKIFDSFEENDTAYIVMEYLDGETLTSYLKKVKTIPEDVAVAMMMPVMESLQIVHEAGLLHRDIAPDNIFLTTTGEVKLIDFGASRYATTSHSRSLTVIIKPGFSPEEQYRSRGDQGPHTDVYAIAATLYKMITGKTPPDAMERRAKYENKSKDILEEPHKINKKISRNRENAILNAMNVRVEDRTPDIEKFIKDLNADPPVKRVYGKIKKIDLYSWPLWIKILVPLLLSVILVFGALLVTGKIKFSKHTDKIEIPENIMTVPDVEGMYKDEALKKISESSLLASANGTVESEYIPAGKIVFQSPVGGSYMEINGKVLLTVSSGEEVSLPENGVSTVPYVIWDKKDDAVSKLLMAGLAEPEITEVNDETVPMGSVISQVPESGTKVDENTVIRLTVSKGPSAFEIPNVVGKNKDEAEKILNENGLSVVIEYEKNDDVPEDEVVRQSVSAGTSLKRGDKIVLTISSGKKTIIVPDVTGKTESEAEDILKEQGFNVKILENYDTNVENGKVISLYPDAGTSQLPDTTIVVYVSKGKYPLTVSFNGNGGSVDETSKTVYVSDEYGTLPTPSRTGYKFEGWSPYKSGGDTITSLTEVTAYIDHVLYASWSPDTYTVSLDAKGGSVSKTTVKVTYGAGYTEIPTPSRTGYTFCGWSLNESGDSIINSSTVVNTASDHKLYAKWTANQYIIKFTGNGTGYSGAKTVNYGEAYGTLPTPERDYYDFVGWFTKPDGGVKVDESTVMTTAGDVTYYAHWNEHPLSDWVDATDIPEDAEVEKTQWIYTFIEKTTSLEKSLSGWTLKSWDWVELPNTNSRKNSEICAEFPSGFDTSDEIYNKYNIYDQKPFDNYVDDKIKDEVTWEKEGYIYWHWTKKDGNSDGEIYDHPDTDLIFYAFESNEDYQQEGDYYVDGNSERWFRIEYGVWNFVRKYKVYNYERVSKKITGDMKDRPENIMETEMQVKYRVK